MSTAFYLGGDVECNYNTFKNFKSDLGTSMSDYGQNGQIRTINGVLCFYYNGWHALEEATLPIPANTVFVSYSFNNIFPFYSTINNAITNSDNGWTIIIYPGFYEEDIDISRRHTYAYSKTVLYGSITIDFGNGNTSLSGKAILGDDLGASVKIKNYYAGIIGNVEFESIYEGASLEFQSFVGNVKFDSCNGLGISGTTTLSSPNNELHISCDRINYHIQNTSENIITYLNVNTVHGHLEILNGKTIVHCKYFSGLNVNTNTPIVYISGTSSSVSNLKIVDAEFNPDWDGDPPIWVDTDCTLILQHCSVYNKHDAAIDIIAGSINTHKLKVDNCILNGTNAIDSQLSGQYVHCFGSWGINNVSSSVTMRTESLNIGDIW